MAARKVKPSTATRANRYTYAYVDGPGEYEPYGELTIEDSLAEAKEGGEEGDIVEMYELVPRGRYKLGGWTEVK